MEALAPVRLILLVIANAISFGLGVLVVRNDRKNITHQIFLFLSLITCAWLSVNYISAYVLPESLLWVRLSIFFAAPLSLFFFLLAHTLPSPVLQMKKWVLFVLSCFTVSTMVLNMSPYAFIGIKVTEGPPTPIPGPGLLPFALLSTLFSISAAYVLFRKWRHSVDAQRRQFGLVMTGIAMMLGLIIMTVFIPIALFENSTFVPFIPAYTLVFLGMTAYAIVKYRFLDVKVIATEFLVVIIWVVLFSKLFTALSAAQRMVDGLILSLTVAFGLLLIRSVRREVEQRERMEALSLELAQANERLEELDKLKSEFVGMAGHQLRAPLTVIKGYVSLIMEGTIDGVSQKAKEALGKVQYSTDQLVKLVSSLLDLSRIESGKIKYEFAAHDFSALVTEVVDKFRPNAEKKGVALVYENTLGPASFTFDADKIREAVMNYVDNAIKYTEKGEARVTLVPMQGPDGKWARLEVKDSGIGIKKNDIWKLFGKFSRTDEAKQKDPNGMGIGIYFAKRMVQDHGGNVGAFSEGIGKGSTFWMELPMRGAMASKIDAE